MPLHIGLHPCCCSTCCGPVRTRPRAATMTANGTPNGEGTVGDDRGERRPERRVHLSEAAELLGVSKDAIRMRVKRGTLRSEKGEDGRVYVWVNVTPEGDRSILHPE